MNEEDEYLRIRYREEMEDLRKAISLLISKKQWLEKQDKPSELKIQLYDQRIEDLNKAVEDVKKKARTDGMIIL